MEESLDNPEARKLAPSYPILLLFNINPKDLSLFNWGRVYLKQNAPSDWIFEFLRFKNKDESALRWINPSQIFLIPYDPIELSWKFNESLYNCFTWSNPSGN